MTTEEQERTEKQLPEWVVEVTMARRVGEAWEYRTFTTTLPAPDEEHARRGATDFALAINEASGYVWKLTDSEDVVRLATPEEPTR